jgi:methylmalonyl-CoA/ethylmalonyl-CoA epimerase
MSDGQKTDARIDLGPVVQVGIVVHDVEKALAAWTSRFVFDEPQIIDWPVEGTDMAKTGTYRGRYGEFRMRLGFIQAGPVQIEFIQPLEGENIYAEHLEQHGEGIHHLLFEVDDPRAVASQLGAPIMQSGGSTLKPGAIWAYLDTHDVLSAIVELRTKV